MTEHDARQVLLVRTLERQPPSDTWTDTDRQQATQEALRRCGPDAPQPVLVATRAAVALQRLDRRQPGLSEAVHALQWRPWIDRGLMLLALIAGLLFDAVGAGQRVNILNPPLLLVLLWNLLTYLMLAVNAVWPGARLIQRTGLHGLLMDLATRGSRRRKPPAANPDAASTPDDSRAALLARFRPEWFRAAAPLHTERAFALLHAAALCFALGTVAGLYLRGLGLEYLASWESTFLRPEDVTWLVHALWGPASLVSGIPLPDLAGIIQLRHPTHPGENAAPWIHLQMLTVFMVVILPRLALTVLHRLRARRLGTQFPLTLDDGYFHALRRTARGETQVAWVQPYSYTLAESSRNGLQQHLRQEAGDTTIDLRPSIALGAEDDMRAPLPGIERAALAVALFNLSATPEAENHAVFLDTLARLLPPNLPLHVIVDEGPFRARFGADSARLDSRRNAWQKILATRSDLRPVFIDLGVPPAHQPSALHALAS